MCSGCAVMRVRGNSSLVGNKLFTVRLDPQKRLHASGADHGQNSSRAMERNTKRHFGLASIANGLCCED